MSVLSEHSPIPWHELVGTIGLGAPSRHKLVLRALLLGLDHTTVMKMQDDILIERLAGLDPVNG